MTQKHDYDAAWKSILEAFEIEIVELLFPELYCKIDWERGTESLDKELLEIQKDMFDKSNSQLIISDKIIKVRLKNNEQAKALADFLEYLFLIQDEELKGKYIEYKENIGGMSNMSIDEIKKMYYENEGIEKGKIEIVLNILDEGLNEEMISKFTKIDIEKVKDIKTKYTS